MRFELVLGEIYHVVGVLTSWIALDHIIGESFTFFTKMMLGKKKRYLFISWEIQFINIKINK